MPATAIDLSAGLKPPPAPASGGIDLSAGLTPGARPAPNVTMPAHDALTENSQGEGVYQMSPANGEAAPIPYSKVAQAHRMGYQFANEGDRGRYAKDFAAEPINESKIDQVLQMQPWWAGPGILEGLGHGAESLGSGLDQLGRDAQQAVTGKQPRLTAPEEALRNEAAKPNKLPGAGVGEVAEAGAEMMGLDELLALIPGAPQASLAMKLKELQPVAQVIEKFPIIGKLLKVGAGAVKTGSLAGVQNYIHSGGDAGQALTTGLATGATAGAIGAGSTALESAIASRATTLEDIGGVKMPVSAETRAARPTAAQQTGQEAIRNAARSSAQPHLEEAAQARETPAGPAQLPPRTGPYTFELQGPPAVEGQQGDLLHEPESIRGVGGNRMYQTASAERTAAGPAPGGSRGTTGADISTATERPNIGKPEARQDVVGGGGTLRTQDAAVAESHLRGLNQVIDSPAFEKMPPARQQELVNAQRDTMRQIAEHREQVLINSPGYSKPSLEPIDIPKTLARVGSYTDAANELEKVATQGYEFMNDVSGGRYSAIWQANKDAWNAVSGASGEEGLQNAEKQLDASNKAMDRLMHQLRGIVSDRELDSFADAFRNAQNMKRVAQEVDSTFVGNPSSSARSWEYRGFNGQQLMQNLSKLEQKMGRPALNRIMGSDNLDTLYQVAELNRTQAGRAKFGADIKPIVKSFIGLHAGPLAVGGALGRMAGVPWEVGAGAGWATAAATRRVLNSIATNPQVAKQVIYALDYGAKPESYGPFIAGLIEKAQQGDDNAR